MSYAVLSYKYAGFDIEEPIGEVPQLVLKIRVIAEKIEGGRVVYVPQMKCDVELFSVTSLDYPAGSNIGSLGSYTTLEPTLVSLKNPGETKFCIPLNSPKIEKMLEIRRNNKLVSLRVLVSVFCFVVDGTGENHPRNVYPIITRGHVKKHTPTGGLVDYITFSSEELTEIIEKVKHYKLIRVEVLVNPVDKPPHNHVAKSLDLLKSASNKLARGDLMGALKDVRDSIMNHLTVSVKEGEEIRRHFRKDIVEAFLKKVPQEARNEYEKALKGIEHGLISLLQNFISKFIHLDSDVIERAPLHEDVEYAYLITLRTTEYLAKYLAR